MRKNPNIEGGRRYEKYWATQMADQKFRSEYEEQARKKELWLALVEARHAAGQPRSRGPLY